MSDPQGHFENWYFLEDYHRKHLKVKPVFCLFVCFCSRISTWYLLANTMHFLEGHKDVTSLTFLSLFLGSHYNMLQHLCPQEHVTLEPSFDPTKEGFGPSPSDTWHDQRGSE